MGRRCLVVVGGGAAGMSAAAKAARVDGELRVLVYEKGHYISFAACGIPYFVAGDVAESRQLVVRTPAQMAERGVEAHIRHEVTGLDVEARMVQIRDLERNTELSVSYDKLVIGSGARPVRPSLPGSDLVGIFGVRSLESGLAIQRFLASHPVQKAVVIGGGYVGLEMAETFRRRGLDVTMVIRSGRVMRSSLDDDVRELVTVELASHGVDLLQSTPVAFEGDKSVSAVLTEHERIPCDIALLGMGARPNVRLAREAGLVVGKTGAIATNNSMQTSVKDVYAAGDCAEAQHLVTGEPAYMPLGSTANKQGRVAGTNAAGGSADFAGIVGTTVVRVFDQAVASTGLTADYARAHGYRVAETLIKAGDISHYMPGASDIHVKLVVEEDSGRLLGGQIVGRRGVAKRIDVLATALYSRMTVADLRQLDLSYAPPFAPVWDPILVAANVASK
jgi:NADPH-dependent 2,4-dienoyl-CoA reductase/sulfur reductase-like enzyme